MKIQKSPLRSQPNWSEVRQRILAKVVEGVAAAPPLSCPWCNPYYKPAADGNESTGICPACLERLKSDPQIAPMAADFKPVVFDLRKSTASAEEKQAA